MKDGWFEYLTDKDHRSYGLKIFHHMEIGAPLGYCCSYQPNGRRRVSLPITSWRLVQFISHDGLAELLKVQKHDKLDSDEVSLMIRRLHIPGYEQARRFFETAILEGIIHPPSTPGFFCQEDIQAVWSHYRIQNLNTLQQEQSP